MSVSTTDAIPHQGALRRATGTFLEVIELLFTAGARNAALQRLLRESDAQLAARGTTRDAELRRILGPGGLT